MHLLSKRKLLVSLVLSIVMTFSLSMSQVIALGASQSAKLTATAPYIKIIATDDNYDGYYEDEIKLIKQVELKVA